MSSEENSVGECEGKVSDSGLVPAQSGRRRDHGLTWRSLGVLGKNRLLTRSYVWLLVVPIAAKCLQSIESPLSVTILGATAQIHLRLPFSWTLFYFAALMFTVASLFYWVSCPRLVREHSSFREFRESGRGFEQLRRMLVTPDEEGVAHTFRAGQPATIEVSSPVLNQIKLLAAYGSDPNLQGKMDVPAPLSEAELAEAFWGFYGPLDRSRRGRRSACAILYGLGLVCIAVIMVQNLCFVLRALM